MVFVFRVGWGLWQSAKKLDEQLKKTQNTNNHLISLIEDMLMFPGLSAAKWNFYLNQPKQKNWPSLPTTAAAYCP